MSAVIGALRAELSASIAKFQEDMGRAAQVVKKFADGATKQGEKLTRVGKTLSIALTVPLVAFGIKAVQQGKEAAQALGQVEAALASTGAQSGKTAAELQKSAKALELISTFDDDEILRKVTANLLTFGNVTGDVFDRAQKAIINLSARMGTDLQTATIQVGRALNQPVDGLAKLKRAGIDLGDEQEKLVKRLVATGRGAEAQGVILKALEAKFAGAAEAARKNDPFAVLAQSIRNLMEAAGPLITGFLVPVTDALKALADWFVALPTALQDVVVGFGLFLAALGPVVGLIGTVLKLVGFLTPILVPLGAALAGLSVATWGWVAAIVAGVAALVILWKAVKDVIHGDFAKAWDDARASAKGLWDDLHGMFKAKPIVAPVQIAVGGKGGKGGPTHFDLPPELVAAQKTLEKAIRDMQTKINAGFDEVALPSSIAKANALNAQIDEFIRTAQEADVNTAAFAAQIAGLRAEIERLKAAGLDKEALKFARAVNEDDIAVRRFAKGSLDPLSEKLDSIDEAYLSLRDKIEAQIEDNAVLAGSNDAAAEAMARLRDQLTALDLAHQSAADAAREQWKAESRLADLQTTANNIRTRQQIEDLKQAKGEGAPISRDQERLQAIARDLTGQRIEAEQRIAELAAQRTEAVRIGDTAQADRLATEITLQQQLFDLVKETSSEQVLAAQKIADSFRTFTDDLSDTLANMISDWKGDLDGLRAIFKKLASDLFIKPTTDAVSQGIGGFLKQAAGALGASFGGGAGAVPGSVAVTPQIVGSNVGGYLGPMADGGFVSPGHWAIAGEGGKPEPVFGGRHGATVVANDDVRWGGAGTNIYQTWNVQSPDANSFRRTQRQTTRIARQGLGV